MAYEFLPAGSCHCAAIQVDLVLSTAPEELRVRACQCGFCWRRGARTISDPDGAATIRAVGPEALIRYRFGLRTADYLVCANCGTYVAAVQPDELPIGVINVGGLGVPEFDELAAEPVDYNGETVADRLARRRGYWMPIGFAYSSGAQPAPVGGR
ncbi:MAG: glutathione-dependent formaldehyde-activating [Enterovirga sp.]|nr:glutathione-dependent formaldehyde-activating [Enterovirga sp.]